MKICKKCNLSYDDNKKFCKKCGSALVTDYRIESMADAKKTILEDRLKADPLNVELLHEYAQFLFNNSILKETISVSLKLRVIDEKDTFAKELLYKSYFKLNMLIEAMEYGKLLLSERPNDISLLQELAEIACKMENAELETEFYNQILEIDPTHVDALLNKAHCFLKESQLEKAVSIFGNLWDDGNTKDRVITIYAGIDKTLKSDYAGAIKLLRPILSEDDLVKKNDIDTNRGILYLTYSLCQNEEKLAEIKRWAIKVNYDNLERNHHPLDEKIAFSIAELIINRSLNEVLSSNEVKKQIADLTLFIPESTYSRNSDLKIAEIWFAVGLKQEKFKLLKDATKSFSKAVVLAPGDNRYKEKLIETEKLLERHTRKRNKKIIFSIVTSFVSLIVIISAIFVFKYYEEIKAFDTAKNINSMDSYRSYLNKYPKGKFYIEAIELHEEHFWNYTNKLNTVLGYDNFIAQYGRSKYIKEAYDLREDALWNASQNTRNFEDYIRQYPTGKYIKQANYLREEASWNNAKKTNTASSYQSYMVKYPKGKYYYEALKMKIKSEGYGMFTDSRDGRIYKTVKIGNQVWMAENLAYLPSVSPLSSDSHSSTHYYVYGYNGTSIAAAKATSNYQTYGVLYNWPAAMNGASSSNTNPSGVQGICPTGWHLPSEAEWNVLIIYLGGKDVAGGKMKETGTLHWKSPNSGANNKSRFTALPGGIYWGRSTFNYKGNRASFWTSFKHDTYLAQCRSVYWEKASISSDSYSTCASGNEGLSVRCVKN